jgi:hypothetical protein
MSKYKSMSIEHMPGSGNPAPHDRNVPRHQGDDGPDVVFDLMRLRHLQLTEAEAREQKKSSHRTQETQRMTDPSVIREYVSELVKPFLEFLRDPKLRLKVQNLLVGSEEALVGPAKAFITGLVGKTPGEIKDQVLTNLRMRLGAEIQQFGEAGEPRIPQNLLKNAGGTETYAEKPMDRETYRKMLSKVVTPHINVLSNDAKGLYDSIVAEVQKDAFFEGRRNLSEASLAVSLLQYVDARIKEYNAQAGKREQIKRVKQALRPPDQNQATA